MLGLVLTMLVAAAVEPQVFTWDITFLGQPIGEQTLEVTYDQNEDGLERVFRSTTHIDARPVDFEHVSKSVVAARAGSEPASFNATVVKNGETSSSELRWNHSGLYLSQIDAMGRATTRALPPDAADLSTADLFDPRSHVPLTRFDSVTVISAETGEMWSSQVRRLGPSQVTIDGTELLVEGVVLHPPEGRTALFYGTIGVPIRYEYYVEGRLFEAILHDLPPPGVDEQPVPEGRPTIRAEELE
ncbi:MAG: hypothetical protein JRJ84_11045 [Deltaproteobacteria bacterium]|nr:hypothetical protein [Deltaproteobacteria bacterium]